MSAFIDTYLAAVEGQAGHVARKHGPLANIEQGYGLLMEEIDEYFDEVKKKREHRDAERMALELVDIAVVAYRICQGKPFAADMERLMEDVENQILNDDRPQQRPHAIYGLLFRYAIAFGDPRANRWEVTWMVAVLVICGRAYCDICSAPQARKEGANATPH